MEITGKILQILPEESGEGRNGPWKKQSFILETQDQYPKKVCITTWGDRIDLSKFQENDVVTTGINIESREYNGRWYTDVKAWRMDAAQEAESPSGYQNIPPEKELPPEVAGEPDDLPF